MVEIICEKTGLKFEAENRRRKCHPVVQSWFARAYEEGWYQMANDAVYGSRTRYIEKRNFATIEEFVAYFEKLQQNAVKAKAQDAEAAKARRKQEAEAQDALRARRIRNDLLRGRGYKWRRWENDEEDIDMFGAPEVEWVLYSPDGRVVSVREAMQELASQNVSFAKEYLEKRGIALEEKVAHE